MLSKYLRQVSDELMEDEALRPFILDSFDYMGVDALEEFSVVLWCASARFRGSS